MNQGLDVPALLGRVYYRYPSYLLDAVTELDSGNRLVAVKNVTVGEEFFQGHFPGSPLMPAVLTIEALTQTAAVMLLDRASSPVTTRVSLRGVDGVKVLMPAGTFYVFPDVSAICRRLGIVSHGLAMYLLEGADDKRGVACLGGECFGAAGQGFLRFSCAEPDERLQEAVAFLAEAVTRTERVRRYLDANPKYRLPM